MTAYVTVGRARTRGRPPCKSKLGVRIVISAEHI